MAPSIGRSPSISSKCFCKDGSGCVATVAEVVEPAMTGQDDKSRAVRDKFDTNLSLKCLVKMKPSLFVKVRPGRQSFGNRRLWKRASWLCKPRKSPLEFQGSSGVSKLNFVILAGRG